MVDSQDAQQVPPNAVIVDTISNLVGAYVNGLSKRTQYYSFIDTAKGNSLQQPYFAWFAKQVIEPLEKAEKRTIQACFKETEQADDNSSNPVLPILANRDRLYRGILIDDPDKVALAESRFSRCKGWFEETHRETELYRAFFILDRILSKANVPQEKLDPLPDLLQLTCHEFDKIYQSYDEQLLDLPNVVEDRFQTTLATLLSSPLYWIFYGIDTLLYRVLGISNQYPDLEARWGLSLRLVPLVLAIGSGFREDKASLPIIVETKLVGLGTQAERQAVKISTWLASNSFSKLKDLITENGKVIINNGVAIALGALLSATIVTRFYSPPSQAIDPAFLDAVEGAKFDLFTFKNGDLGIVTYEMPQVPERMRFGEVCRISWRDVNRSLHRNQTGNIMDLADLRCQDGFLASPLKAFYDERSKEFAATLAEQEQQEDQSIEEQGQLSEASSSGQSDDLISHELSQTQLGSEARIKDRSVA